MADRVFKRFLSEVCVFYCLPIHYSQDERKNPNSHFILCDFSEVLPIIHLAVGWNCGNWSSFPPRHCGSVRQSRWLKYVNTGGKFSKYGSHQKTEGEDRKTDKSKLAVRNEEQATE